MCIRDIQLAELTILSVWTTSLPAKYLQKPAQQPPNWRRNFSSNPILFKKKTRVEREREEEAEEEEEVVEDPFDFSSLEEGISKALDKLKNDLSRLRTGGRFNPEALENLRVHLNKDSKASERLGDLAQVLPKGGRSLMILVGEKEVSCCLSSEIWRHRFADGRIACKAHCICNSGVERSQLATAA